MEQLMESMVNEKAERAFNEMIRIVNKHGTCFFRFTLEDGIVIIVPRHTPMINGVIADA